MDKNPTIIYTPQSQLRSPRKLLVGLWRDILASRELAWRLVVRDISARYRQSLLGVVWAFLPAIMTAGIFIALNKAKIVNIPPTKIPYPVFVLFGTILWEVFVSSLGSPIASVNRGKSMLSKINFPREALILASLGRILFDFGIKLVILFGIFVYFKIPLSWGLLLFPVMVFGLILLGIVIGLVLVPAGVLYKDVSAVMFAVTRLWFFITPVAYPRDISGTIGTLMKYNPVTPLLTAARDLATRGHIEDPLAVCLTIGISLAVLVVVAIVYRISLPILIERMSA